MTLLFAEHFLAAALIVLYVAVIYGWIWIPSKLNPVGISSRIFINDGL